MNLGYYCLLFLIVGLTLGYRLSRRVLAKKTLALKKLQRDYEDTVFEYQKQLRRAEEYFGIISGIEGERDTWQKLYYESSRSAGAAQAWLLRTLSQLMEIANKRGGQLKELGVTVGTVKIDPQLRSLIGDFTERHPEGAGAQVPRAPGLPPATILPEASPEQTSTELAQAGRPGA